MEWHRFVTYLWNDPRIIMGTGMKSMIDSILTESTPD